MINIPGCEHGYAEVNGVRLHYVKGGAGTPIVLLHGFPQTWYEWRHVMPRLAEEYTVLAVDLRGCGESEKPVSGYDKVTVAEDIHALAVHLDYNHTYVVGHDIGGAVAYCWARNHPEMVRKLAFIEMVLPGFHLDKEWQANRKLRNWHIYFHMARDMPELLVTGRERLYLSWFFQQYGTYNANALSPEEIDEFVRSYAAPGGLRGGFEHYRAFWEDSEWVRQNLEPKLTLPVLALGGEHALRDEPIQDMREVAENVRGEIVPDASHYIVDEAPEFVLDRLLSFFGARDETA